MSTFSGMCRNLGHTLLSLIRSLGGAVHGPVASETGLCWAEDRTGTVEA